MPSSCSLSDERVADTRYTSSRCTPANEVPRHLAARVFHAVDVVGGGVERMQGLGYILFGLTWPRVYAYNFPNYLLAQTFHLRSTSDQPCLVVVSIRTASISSSSSSSPDLENMPWWKRISQSGEKSLFNYYYYYYYVFRSIRERINEK